MDVIVECTGGDGDPSGLVIIIMINQVSINNAREKMKPPKVGKLPMVPIIELSCSDNLKANDVFQ